MATAPYRDVAEGGTLTMAVSALPVNWVQLQASDLSTDTATIEGPITNQNGLTFTDRGQWRLNHDYIESARLVERNPTTVSVKLNPRGVWSDGDRIDVDDMTSMWKAFNGSNPAYEVDTSGWQDIASITPGNDPFSYTITYRRAFAEWPNYLYPAYPSSVTSNPKTFNTGFTSKPFPTNGPFVVSHIDSGAGVVTETPNRRWWGRKPKLDTIVFRVVSQDSVGRAFANSELSVADTAGSAEVLAAAKRRADADIQRAGGLSYTQVTFNGTVGPLKDLRVRRAVAMSIDRKALTAAVQSGLGVQPSVQDGFVYVPGQLGYQPVIDDALPYSVAKASAQLRDAGYVKAADGSWAKDGKPLALTITVASDSPTMQQRAELIAGYLKKAGIALTIVPVPGSTWARDRESHNYEMLTFIWSGFPFPVSTAEALFYPADADYNYSRITDPSLGGLFDRANAELDPKKQQALAHRIDRTITDLMPMLPLSATPTVWAVQKGLVNLGATQWIAPWFDYSVVGFRQHP